MEWMIGLIGLLIGLFILAAILGGLEGGNSFGETLGRGFKSLIWLIFTFLFFWLSLAFFGTLTGIISKDTGVICGVLAFILTVAAEVVLIMIRQRRK